MTSIALIWLKNQTLYLKNTNNDKYHTVLIRLVSISSETSIL